MNKKDVKICTGYTPEQIAKMEAFYKENDFTKELTLTREFVFDENDAFLFNKTRSVFQNYFINNLQALGVNRMITNFSADFPVNCLLNADKDIVGFGVVELQEIYEIFQDEYIDFFALPHEDGLNPYALLFEEEIEDPEEKAFMYFLVNFYKLFSKGYECYARNANKSVFDLNPDEKNDVKNMLMDIFNQELAQFMMLSQQVPKLYQISNKDNPTHEDQKSKTLDSKNFHKKWNHSNASKVQDMLSLEQVCENSENVAAKRSLFDSDEDYESDINFRELKDSFYQTLDETDKAIFSMKERGMTQKEIAERLSYKTPSAVSKRIDKMKVQLVEFISA